jgi:hypothetical protein
MDGTPHQLDILVDLEARHDDLLRRLEELDKRVEKVLAEWQPARKPDPTLAPNAPQPTLPDAGQEKRAA